MGKRIAIKSEALLAHIAALEAELAHYAATYGRTEDVRRQLTDGPAKAVGPEFSEVLVHQDNSAAGAR